MKKNIVLLPAVLLCMAATSFSQTIKKLQENNGFKKYKLGSKYQSVYGIKTKQEDQSDLVTISYTAEKIADIPIQRIELIYLNDTLSKIHVYIEPHQHSPLFEACKSSFGSPTKDLSDNEATRKQQNKENSGSSYTDQFRWQAQKLNFEYYYLYPKIAGSSYSTKDLHLSYSLNDFTARLERAKKKKYKSSDF
jgi:hypothetical protein